MKDTTIIDENSSLLNDDSGRSNATPIDYETLMNLALEKTSKRVDEEERQRRKRYTTIITMLIVMLISIITVTVLTAVPAEEELHKEVGLLKNELENMHSQLEDMKDNSDVSALHEEIEEKKKLINIIENDPAIDNDTKNQMVHTMMLEIQDIKKKIVMIQNSENTSTRF